MDKINAMSKRQKKINITKSLGHYLKVFCSNRIIHLIVAMRNLINWLYNSFDSS